MKKLFCCIFASLAACTVMSEENVQTAFVPTVAVLHFEARDRAAVNADMGKSVAELLNLALMESGCADFVERTELEKALNELHFSSAGLTEKSSQVKLGRFVGAKILLTGSLFKSEDKNFIVVKVIGTETSRVLGTSVSGTLDYTQLVPELAPKVAAILEKQSVKLLPKPESDRDVADSLKSAVNGKQRKVALVIKENIHAASSDSAAEAELAKLLQTLNFQIIGTPEKADFVIRGEAIAASAGTFRDFPSASARVQLSVYARENRFLAGGSVRETLSGATYIIAAKDAVAQASLRLAGELFGVLK